MSLILEALKKAERQHKLGEVPGISSHAGDQPSGGAGRMGWIMLGLFAVVMLLAGAYLGGGFQSEPEVREQAPVVSNERKPAVSSGAELTARPEHARADMSTSQVSERTVSEPVPQLPTPAMQPDVVETQPPEVTAIAEPEPPPAPRPTPRPAPEPPPEAKLLNEMPAGFVSNLPPMNIDIHSYDQRPEKRYVLINMQRYREGDYLSEGPRVIEIRPDGVEMEHMGARFILPIGAP
ncbi:MAG: general secretion pathway protein GspB [Candidatus Thiodiazotropha sp.]